MFVCFISEFNFCRNALVRNLTCYHEKMNLVLVTITVGLLEISHTFLKRQSTDEILQ